MLSQALQSFPQLTTQPLTRLSTSSLLNLITRTTTPTGLIMQHSTAMHLLSTRMSFTTTKHAQFRQRLTQQLRLLTSSHSLSTARSTTQLLTKLSQLTKQRKPTRLTTATGLITKLSTTQLRLSTRMSFTTRTASRQQLTQQQQILQASSLRNTQR